MYGECGWGGGLRGVFGEEVLGECKSFCDDEVASYEWVGYWIWDENVWCILAMIMRYDSSIVETRMIWRRLAFKQGD